MKIFRSNKSLLYIFLFCFLKIFLAFTGDTPTFYSAFLHSLPILLEPDLFPNEKSILYEYMANSRTYFEFGSGGSTHQAAKRGLKIYSVEISPSWISLLKKEIQQISSYLGKNIDITYLLVDLQSSPDTSYSDFQNYIQIYNHTKYQADLIYVNGKYHFSCLMNLFNQVNQKTIIIVHNLEDKNISESLDTYFTTLKAVDNTIVLQKKDPPPFLSEETIEKIQNQDFTFSNKKIDIVTFLRKNFSDIYDRYKDYNNDEMVKPSEKQIWFYWWDGPKNMPYIAQICLKSIEENFREGNVTFIWKENYKKYATIPDYIMKKFKEKKISKTHFSDVYRMKLLSIRGGLWLDATILVVKKLPSEIFEYPFYTVHFRYTFQYFTGKWCTFLLSSYINNVVTKFCCDVLFAYYQKFDFVNDYFLLDYIFVFGCEFLPSFERTIQKVPLNNQNVMELINLINSPWNAETKKIFDGLLEGTSFFKLSNKKKKFKVVNNTITVYKMLFNQYLK